MVSVDDKFDKFSSIILNDAAKKRDAELKKLEHKKSEMLEKAHDDILEKAYKIVQKGVAEARKNSDVSAAKGPAQAKKEVLLYRASLVDELFGELIKKINEYKKTDEYFVSLCQMTDNALKEINSDDAVICIDKSDEDLKDKLAQKYGLPVITVSGITGGVSVRSAKAGKAANNTYAEKIEMLKGNFLNSVKFTI